MKNIEFASIIRDAVEAADNLYYEMSGGVGVNDNGVEPFVSAYIAQMIHENNKINGENIWISLEEKFGMMLDYSNSDNRGGFAKPHTKSSRVDVAVYENELISFVVEVKRGLRYRWIKNDIHRIDYLLDRLNSSASKKNKFKFGIIAGVATSFKNKKSPSKRLHDIISKIQINHVRLKATPIFKDTVPTERFSTNSGIEVDGVMPYCILLERI